MVSITSCGRYKQSRVSFVKRGIIDRFLYKKGSFMSLFSPMRILSNFNTGLASELLQEATTKFWEWKVLFVRRDRIYVFLKVIFPWIILSVGVVWLIVRSLTWGSGQPYTTISWLLYTILFVIVAMAGIHFIKKLIDYYMDFTIITPVQILFYDQDGIIKRSSRSLDLTKLKSVNIEKDWLLRSMFNFWSIVFFSEWDVVTDDENKLGNIKLNYINYPRKVRDKIVHVIRREEISEE